MERTGEGDVDVDMDEPVPPPPVRELSVFIGVEPPLL